jgi:hypothetical protein
MEQGMNIAKKFLIAEGRFDEEATNECEEEKKEECPSVRTEDKIEELIALVKVKSK